jgi:hypothetical protein
MRIAIVAAVAAVTVGAATASAFAAGLPYGSVPPVYASHAFPNEPYHTGTVFSEVYHNVFGQPKNASAVADRATIQTPTQPKGG